MHTYDRYRPPDGDAVVRFVAEHPFAILVSGHDGRAPVATHLPIVLPPTFDAVDTLVGQTLWGHMGRPNPHWRELDGEPEVLLIHSSSHGYVSPTHYDSAEAAPTLDYAAVHLTGTLRLLDRDAALDVVEQTVRQLESPRDPQWDMEPARGYFRQIIGGVQAFTIDVTGEQAIFKLSQDKQPAERQRIHTEFAAPGCPHTDLAALMEQLP